MGGVPTQNWNNYFLCRMQIKQEKMLYLRLLYLIENKWISILKTIALP